MKVVLFEYKSATSYMYSEVVGQVGIGSPIKAHHEYTNFIKNNPNIEILSVNTINVNDILLTYKEG